MRKVAAGSDEEMARGPVEEMRRIGMTQKRRKKGRKGRRRRKEGKGIREGNGDGEGRAMRARKKAFLRKTTLKERDGHRRVVMSGNMRRILMRRRIVGRTPTMRLRRMKTQAPPVTMSPRSHPRWRPRPVKSPTTTLSAKTLTTSPSLRRRWTLLVSGSQRVTKTGRRIRSVESEEDGKIYRKHKRRQGHGKMEDGPCKEQRMLSWKKKKGGRGEKEEKNRK